MVILNWSGESLTEKVTRKQKLRGMGAGHLGITTESLLGRWTRVQIPGQEVGEGCLKCLLNDRKPCGYSECVGKCPRGAGGWIRGLLHTDSEGWYITLRSAVTALSDIKPFGGSEQRSAVVTLAPLLGTDPGQGGKQGDQLEVITKFKRERMASIIFITPKSWGERF